MFKGKVQNLSAWALLSNIYRLCHVMSRFYSLLLGYGGKFNINVNVTFNPLGKTLMSANSETL